MSRYIFLFGRTPALSIVELRVFFPTLTPIASIGALVQGDIDPVHTIGTLGGTVKIVNIVEEVESVTPEGIAQILANQTHDKQLTFGISRYDEVKRVDRTYLSEVKKQLDALGVSSRYVEARHDTNLSSVVVKKQNITELILIKHNNQTLVGVTRAVQDFESWNKRDYGRPFADPKSGMLPPKVARMVVNIAQRPAQGKQVLLDPFCGMGTVLSEALLSGWNVIGSDISEEVVMKARKNVEWLGTWNTDVTPSVYKIFTSDATHISESLEGDSVDAIVTEPFMGASDIENPNVQISRDKIKNRIKGLEKLYVGCLKDWSKVLKKDGKIVMALPKYTLQGNTYFVKKVIDSCENLGYTQLVGPIEYGRPQAVVHREFYVFQKN